MGAGDPSGRDEKGPQIEGRADGAVRVNGAILAEPGLGGQIIRSPLDVLLGLGGDRQSCGSETDNRTLHIQ